MSSTLESCVIPEGFILEIDGHDGQELLIPEEIHRLVEEQKRINFRIDPKLAGNHGTFFISEYGHYYRDSSNANLYTEN